MILFCSMQKKQYKGSLSFNKAELIGSSVKMSGVGINIRMPETVADYDTYRGTFTSTRSWLNLGWMGNDNKFFQNVSASDVIPKKEDFIEVPFRLISGTIVGGGSWKATDFSNLSILKGSMMKLEGKTVYKDHEQDTNNWIGLVSAVKWTDSFTNPGDNVVVPAGIDGMLMIDTKADPKTARGLLIGSVYSNSVTVDFTYEMSHPFDNEWDFLNKVGQLGADGKMIRRIVTDINDYHETSLVWLGADPFAKAITTDGGLRNIDTSNVFSYCKAKFKEDNVTLDAEGITEEKIGNAKNFTINFGIDKNILPLAAPKQEKETTVTKTSKSMKNFLMAFIAAFGPKLSLSFSTIADGQELTAEQQTELTVALGKMGLKMPDDATTKVTLSDKLIPAMTVAYKAANPDVTKTISFVPSTDANVEVVDADAFLASFKIVAATKLTELETQAGTVQTLTAEKTTLAAKVNELTKANGHVEKHITELRKEAVRLYKTQVGADKADAAVITLMEGAGYDALQGLVRAHLKGATEKFGGKCGDCGSGNFTFQSSIVADEETADETVGSYEMTAADLRRLAMKKETTK